MNSGNTSNYNNYIDTHKQTYKHAYMRRKAPEAYHADLKIAMLYGNRPAWFIKAHQIIYIYYARCVQQ